jgi:hypothetical protein
MRLINKLKKDEEVIALPETNERDRRGQAPGRGRISLSIRMMTGAVENRGK